MEKNLSMLKLINLKFFRGPPQQMRIRSTRSSQKIVKSQNKKQNKNRKMSKNKMKVKNQDINVVSNLMITRYQRIYKVKNSILKSRFKIYSILKIHGKIHYLHKIDKDVHKSRRCLFSLHVSSTSHSFEAGALFMMQHFEIDVTGLGGNFIINLLSQCCSRHG